MEFENQESDCMIDQVVKLLETTLDCDVTFLHKATGGIVNDSYAFNSKKFGKLFVKMHRRVDDSTCQNLHLDLLQAELDSLTHVHATQTFRTPQPVKLIDTCKPSLLVLEYVDMKPVEKYWTEAGTQLARLHLHNIRRLQKEDRNSSLHHKDSPFLTDNFGFPRTTYAGIHPVDNTWSNNWIEFFARTRLKPEFDMIEAQYGDREVRELWTEAQLKLDSPFRNVEILPALLHGDFCMINIGETENEPVTFDCQSVYGHSELDLLLPLCEDVLPSEFFAGYHSLIPKAPGFEDRRS